MTEQMEQEIKDKVIAINRVTKVVKGGRRFSFSALVVVGDGKGKVGYGLGKSTEVPDSIRKATQQARKNMKKVILKDQTIPFEVIGQFGSSKVMMRPAVKGTGVIAGGAVRALAELAGIRDVVTKCHGTSNAHNVIKAAMVALTMLTSKESALRLRGKERPQAQGA